MLGFLGRFGRAEGLRQLDAALRAVDLHPALVPEAVKLATLRQLEAAIGKPAPHDFAAAAELLAYCMVGPEAFTEATDAALTQSVEARIEAATLAGDSLDARLVLLTLHAGLTQPVVVARFGLEDG